MKTRVSREKQNEDIGCESIISSSPSTVDEGFPMFSDIPIMKIVDSDSEPHSNINLAGLINLIPDNQKPQGSAYISVLMSIGSSPEKVAANLCVDTGADFTVCDSAFLISHFGSDALKHLYFPDRLPKLRSASGHELPLIGMIKTVINMGSYEMKLNVIVDDGSLNIFLLGSDAFYDRLIYDKGKFIAFADDAFPPIPIRYELVKNLVKSINQYQIAPRSSALIQVKVTENDKLTGKEVLLTPLTEVDKDVHLCEKACNLSLNDESPVRNTVSVIDPQGNSFVLIENDSDDILTILPDICIANAELISEEEGRVNLVGVATDQDQTSSVSPDGRWPISALKGELADKIPSNVFIQWDKIKKATFLKEVSLKDPPENVHNVNYVHDKEERKHLLDGTGEGFPTPPAADSIHQDQDQDLDQGDVDPEAWLTSVEHEHLSEADWEKLKAVLLQNKEAFSKSKTEIGCCNYFKVDLPLKPNAGFLYNKPRPLPFKHREMAAETISELLAKGVIRPSKSPHATNIVVVKKKTMNGVVSHRICVDLRQVNENSIPNRFPNYWIEDAMAKIQGAAFRTALDFKDAFHMLVLTEESIPVTAFYFNNVLFEYVRVPFGHVCAMNVFCCLMALLCVGYDSSSYYADDLMITTKTDHQASRDQLFNLHLEHISGMLERIVVKVYSCRI